MPNKNNISRYYLFLYLIFSIQITVSQTSPAKETITNAFERYFELERENIHVQLVKNAFITNESIWFKGYVYNKKLNLPFYETTNVYVQLINESGSIVTNQLLYSMSGFFSGKINLDKKIKSGYYYLQFYTNWMNNFEEDESYVQRIKIKNTFDDGVALIDEINPQKINLEFYPEGGNFIADIPNSIGVKITDINGKPIPNCLLEIRDKNDLEQKNIAINSFGMGKFELEPNQQNYKAVVIYKDQKFEYSLPISKANGIGLEINNYILENKTLVKIKYNKEYANALKNKNLYLVVQKNGKSNIIDLKLEEGTTTTTLSFSNELLFYGVNSIRIIDSEMNELAQRLLFKNGIKNSKISINQAYKSEKKIDLSGNSNWQYACVSVAALPKNTKLIPEENIITSLTLNNFLNEKVLIKSDYFNEINRAKKHELDLMMLTQKSNKYDWNTIKAGPAKPIYPFEKGLDIKGTINSAKADLKKCRIQLKNLLADVLSSTELIENNEFYLKNTTVTDSLPVICSLIDRKDRSKKEMNYYLTITNKYRKFNKNYVPVPYVYSEKKDDNSIINMEMPRFDSEIIYLKEIDVKKEKNILKRQTQSGNSYLRGYKVGVDVSENMDVLAFIEQNGFTVSRNAGDISIVSRSTNSLYSARPTPLVYIDGRLLQFSYDELFGLRMLDLDEIYISSTAIVASINNNLGIIKLYRKQSFLTKTDPTNKPKILVGGFEILTSFTNADYTSELTPGFENFGLIHWSPWILTDENGNLNISIPNKKHKSATLLIEGFTMDGKLISESKEVILEE